MVVEVSKLFDQFEIDTGLERRIRTLFDNQEFLFDPIKGLLEEIYERERNRVMSAKKIITVARRRYGMNVSDDLLQLLTADKDAQIYKSTIIASFADRELFEYLERNCPRLYHLVQTCP